MDIQVINITSFRGISSDAEHFYAKVCRIYKDSLWMSDSLERISSDGGEELRYHPTAEEARRMYLKDNPKGNPDSENGKATAAVYMEEGTIRFPSVESVIARARELYPDSILFFKLFGSRKKFLEYAFDGVDVRESIEKAFR